MTLLIFFFVLSILFSFLCSIWEAVLLSITPAYINRQVQDGTAIGAQLQEYKEDIDRPLSAILTLNTIAHTVGAIGVGAQAGNYFKDSEPLFGLFSWEQVVAALMTLAILVLSEIIPKTLGANLWKQLAPFTMKSLKILMWILTPFIWLSQLITKNLKTDKHKSVFSKADLSALATASEESGVLAESESTIIKNLLKFEELVVRDIMTPRTVTKMANEEESLMDFYSKNQPLHFSRIPIYRETTDDITGVVLKDDILQHLVEGGGDKSLKVLKRDLLTIRDDKPLPELFETLTQKRHHMAIVMDDYGSVVGIVTMEDVFETLLGLEITDESDGVADLQALARKKWEKRAKERGLIE